MVGFDDQVELLLPPTPVSENERVLASVEDLYPRGSTNLAEGLSLGYEQARSAYRPGGINVVVLCSDGVANVGMTGPDGITASIAEAGREGIHLVTVGYGMGNYNDHLMEQLADQGDGFYRYVDTYEEAQDLYVEELTSLLAPVADDARTQVRFDPELVSSYRLVGYENRAMDDHSFDDLSADAGELGAGHHASALYEVWLAPDVAPGTQIGTAQVLWKTPSTNAPATASAEVFAADPEGGMSDSLALATAVADLAQVAKGYGAEYEPPASAYDVQARAAELASRGVPGAAELASSARDDWSTCADGVLPRTTRNVGRQPRRGGRGRPTGGEGLVALDGGADHAGEDQLEVSGARDGRVTGVDQRDGVDAYAVARRAAADHAARGLERDDLAVLLHGQRRLVATGRDGAQDRRHRDRVGAPVVDPALAEHRVVRRTDQVLLGALERRTAVAHRDQVRRGARPTARPLLRAEQEALDAHLPGRVVEAEGGVRLAREVAVEPRAARQPALHQVALAGGDLRVVEQGHGVTLAPPYAGAVGAQMSDR